ncbi:MAG: D-alanyl-D-alanine carboxypeptidase, partial [Deltaproteobacteria bacterium]
MAIRGGTIPAILAIGVLFAGGGTAGTGETPLARIERRIAELPRTAEVGISLVSLDTGKPLLEIDADRPMIPASVTKIFTVSAALARLGPAYRFKTRVFAD